MLRRFPRAGGTDPQEVVHAGRESRPGGEPLEGAHDGRQDGGERERGEQEVLRVGELGEGDLPFRRVLEDALVLFLRQQGKAPDGDIKLRKHVFRGKGLRKELRDAEWEVIRELAYEGRGGKDRKE